MVIWITSDLPTTEFEVFRFLQLHAFGSKFDLLLLIVTTDIE